MYKKLSSLDKDFNLFDAAFNVSVPLISSDPTFNNETFGFSSGNNDLNKAEPMISRFGDIINYAKLGYALFVERDKMG